MAKAAREAYENAVASLAALAANLREEGKSDEEIARHLVDLRNDLKRSFRANDPPSLVAQLERRNVAKYGDPLGPTASQMLEKYGDWSKVIEAACRPARLSRLL